MMPSPSRPLKVGLLGCSVDGDNLGVRALAVSLIHLIRRENPEAEIRLLIGNRTAERLNIRVGAQNVEVEIVNFRLSPRSRPSEHLFSILALCLLYRLAPVASLRRRIRGVSPWIDAVLDADLIGEIRGGDSFADIYGKYRFITGVLPLFSIFLLGRKAILFPQTYGPFRSPPMKWLARRALRRASRIYARDRRSVEAARELMGCGQTEPQFCPDVAFTLPAADGNDVAVEPPIPEHERINLIGLNVSGLLYEKENARQEFKGEVFGFQTPYRDVMRHLVERLLADPQAHVMLVPHVLGDAAESDVGACRALRDAAPSELRARIHLALGPYDQSQIKGLIGACDFFIGSRMHACIAAISQGIPAVGIAYSRKFAGVFDSAGVGDLVVDPRGQTPEAIAESCLDRYARRDAIARRLRENIPGVREQIHATFREIMNGVSVRRSTQPTPHNAAAGEKENLERTLQA